MGPYRAALLSLLLAAPATAQEPGWHYSPLPGEGDRATLGCDREATPDRFTCLAVRCEDDFSTGVYVHSNIPSSGPWDMTIDRENKVLVAEPTAQAYSGRFVLEAEWLLERIRQGTFVYLRPQGSTEPFRFISLDGSLRAINSALAWCAPRVPEGEPIPAPDVDEETRSTEKHDGPTSPGPQ
jgi:hypothetical protein